MTISREPFYGGPICVHKRYTFTGLAQRAVKETIQYSKSKYKIPVLGAGTGGIKKDRMFQNFGMFLSKKLNEPKNKCFSSNNLYLCDDSNRHDIYLANVYGFSSRINNISVLF